MRARRKMLSERIAYYTRKGYEHLMREHTNQYRGRRIEAYKQAVYARIEGLSRE